MPSFIVKQDIKGSYIYIADMSANKARKRYVTTGFAYEDQTMIQEGVEEGDFVITQGFAQVSDGVDIVIR